MSCDILSVNIFIISGVSVIF